MTQSEFRNALCVLHSTDRHELEAAGVLEIADFSASPGVCSDLDRAWERFRDDPFRWFIRASDEDAAKVWGIIEERSRVRVGQLVEGA